MSARYSIAMRAYPAEYRRAHGAELIQTANDLAPQGWSARQSRSLLVEGLRTRARLSTNGSAAQLWGGAIAVALALTYLLWSAFVLNDFVGTGDGVRVLWPYPRWLALAQGLVPLTVLTWSTRWPTATVITVTNLVLGATALSIGAVGLATVPFVLLTTTAAWWLATKADGRRALSHKTAIAGLVGLVGTSMLFGSLEVGLAVALVQFGSLVLALALVTIDPRPLIVATSFYLLTTATTVFSLVDGSAFRSQDLLLAAASIFGIAVAVLVSRLGTRRLLAP
jgi:hypothetical protein